MVFVDHLWNVLYGRDLIVSKDYSDSTLQDRLTSQARSALVVGGGG